MNFALLASGSKGNCTIITTDSTTIMLDCGSTKKYLFGKLKELNIEKEDIDALLITHGHTDHIAQLNSFSDLEIYSPIEFEDIKVKKVSAYEPFEINDITVMPIALSHDSPNTMGYVFTSNKDKLVYLTDTGYVSSKNRKYIEGADTYIIEANHDVEMLMNTDRPQFLKARIFGDGGHMCNEDCGAVLNQVISKKTKLIVLAHISEVANTRKKALASVKEILLQNKNLHKDLILCASGQHEMIQKGVNDEKVDLGTVRCAIGLESMANV